MPETMYKYIWNNIGAKIQKTVRYVPLKYENNSCEGRTNEHSSSDFSLSNKTASVTIDFHRNRAESWKSAREKLDEKIPVDIRGISLRGGNPRKGRWWKSFSTPETRPLMPRFCPFISSSRYDSQTDFISGGRKLHYSLC